MDIPQEGNASGTNILIASVTIPKNSEETCTEGMTRLIRFIEVLPKARVEVTSAADGMFRETMCVTRNS
jgi:hypothetical protein